MALSLRRSRDTAALSALQALDDDLPISTVLERFTAAGLPHPLSAACHPREELLAQVANAGVAAARSIEATQADLHVGNADSHAMTLCKDGPFRLFMALKLQAAEGARVRSMRRRREEGGGEE